jgi:hypothetical protein
MKRSLSCIFAILIPIVGPSCAIKSPPRTTTSSPEAIQQLLASGNYKRIRATARADARADIANVHPRVCYAGTRGTFPVGVPEKYISEVKALPQVPLPSGCTEPLAHAASAYADSYNDELVRYLDSKHD